MLSLCFIVLFLWKHGKNKDKLAYIKQRNDTFINKSVLLDHSVSHHSRHVNPPPDFISASSLLKTRAYLLQFWIMIGIFYSWDRSTFQYQMMCKSSVELGLVYKMFVNKQTCGKTAPEKQTGSRNAAFFWKLNKVIFTLQPKTQRHSLETLFLSESRAALPNEALRWACSCSRSSGRNAYCTELSFWQESQNSLISGRGF